MGEGGNVSSWGPHMRNMGVVIRYLNAILCELPFCLPINFPWAYVVPVTFPTIELKYDLVMTDTDVLVFVL